MARPSMGSVSCPSLVGQIPGPTLAGRVKAHPASAFPISGETIIGVSGSQHEEIGIPYGYLTIHYT